jgi:hypothetical protein
MTKRSGGKEISEDGQKHWKSRVKLLNATHIGATDKDILLLCLERFLSVPCPKFVTA